MKHSLICLLAACSALVAPLALAAEPGVDSVTSEPRTAPMPPGDVEVKPTFSPPAEATPFPAPADDPRVGYLQERVKLLERKVDDLEELNRYRTGTVGLAGLIGDGFSGGIEADLRFLYATYWFGRGFDVGLRLGDDVGRIKAGPLDLRFRLDILDLGVMFYVGGGPFTVTDVQRTWDLSLKAGLSVHIWRGITVRGRIAWYLPNPGTAVDQINASLNEATNTLNPSAVGGGFDRVADFYGRALAAPKADIAILWAF